MADKEDQVGMEITEEVIVEKYEGEYKKGDMPIEVLHIRDGKVVQHEVFAPPMDSSLAVNTQILGADNASN
jgi:hypothetical protein